MGHNDSLTFDIQQKQYVEPDEQRLIKFNRQLKFIEDLADYSVIRHEDCPHYPTQNFCC